MEVSIVIPHRNGKQYLIDAVESIANQTYKPAKVILVDDCSNEEHWKYAQAICNQFHIDTVRLPELSGLSEVRNAGLELVNTPLAMFLDCDDKLAPTYIERCSSLLSNNHSAKIAYGKVSFFEAKEGIWDLPEPINGKVDLRQGNCIPSTAMFRTEQLRTTGKYDKDLILEDWDMWIRHLGCDGEVAFIPEVISYYRMRKDNTSLTDNLRKSPRRLGLAFDQIKRKHADTYFNKP